MADRLRGERRDHPARSGPEPRLPRRRLPRAANADRGASDVQRAAHGPGRRRPGRPRRVPRVRAGSSSSASTGSPRTCSSSRSSIRASSCSTSGRTTCGRPSSRRSSRRCRRLDRRGVDLDADAAGRAAPDPPRSAAGRPGRHEPRRQRDQVHAEGRFGRGGRLAVPRRGADRRERHRNRDRRARAAADLRPVLPRLSRERGPRQRQRARAGDRSLDRRHARRLGDGRQPARDGQPLHRLPAAATRGSEDSQPPSAPFGQDEAVRVPRLASEGGGNFTDPGPAAEPRVVRLTVSHETLTAPCRPHAERSTHNPMTDRRDTDPDDDDQVARQRVLLAATGAALRLGGAALDAAGAPPAHPGALVRDRAASTGRTGHQPAKRTAGIGTVLTTAAPRGHPRLGRDRARPERDGRARPAGRAGDRRIPMRQRSSSRSRSTNRRPSSMSRRRPARPSSRSGPARRSTRTRRRSRSRASGPA